MATASETLAKMYHHSCDRPEDYLRDLAGAVRSKKRVHLVHELTTEDTEILDAIADMIESARLRVAKINLTLNPHEKD